MTVLCWALPPVEASVCFCSAHRQQRELGAGWSLCDCREGSFPAHNHPIPNVPPLLECSQRLSRQAWFWVCSFTPVSNPHFPVLQTQAASWSICQLSGSPWHLDFCLPNSSFSTHGSLWMWFLSPSWLTWVERHVYTYPLSSCRLCLLVLRYFTDEQSPGHLGPTLSLCGLLQTGMLSLFCFGVHRSSSAGHQLSPKSSLSLGLDSPSWAPQVSVLGTLPTGSSAPFP